MRHVWLALAQEDIDDQHRRTTLGPIWMLANYLIYMIAFMLIFNGRSAIADRLAAIGRAAFTNYLGSTLIGVALFYGTFGGLYGQLSRGQAWLFVPFIWALMLLWSKWWLDRFAYGPFEWAWRSLARWKLQPMRKRPAEPLLAEA